MYMPASHMNEQKAFLVPRQFMNVIMHGAHWGEKEEGS